MGSFIQGTMLRAIGVALLSWAVWPSVASAQFEIERSPSPTTQWGKIVAGTQIGISAAKETFAAGEPIVVTLSIRSTGGSSLPIAYGSEGPSSYRLSVLDAQGKRAVHRLVGIGESCSAGCEKMRVTLAPGRVYSVDVNITDLYHLEAPGTYTIAASRDVELRQGTGARLLSHDTSGQIQIHIY